ncbi:MAG: anion permease [Nitrospirae bacterium]|uniref:SLC13 family permease n=1 Tax=Candidatus Magnetobacterium casense TaxID=1455061 RepID=UPI000590AA5C|nr:SLC13 family permease [Candidatus Magnetobacterium casensis]MBF0338680.1 anion permease [Nitrospirota bacterium]
MDGIESTDTVQISKGIISRLSNDDILSGIDKRDMAYLLPHVITHRFSSGQSIYNAGDMADNLYILTSGKVKVTYDNFDVIVGEGEKIGIESCTALMKYLSTAVAFTDVTVLMIHREKLYPVLAKNMEVKGKFFSLLVDAIRCKNETQSGDSMEVGFAETKVQKPKDTGKSNLLKATGWVCICLFSPLAMFLGHKYGLDINAFLFMGILTATIGMWVFKLVDEFVPGIFAALATLCLGIAPPEVILSGFVSEGFFMAMSVLGLGAVIITSGLSYRIILLMMLVLPKTQFGLNVGMMFMGSVLTPIIPTANGRIALLSPFYNDIIETTHMQRKNKAATQLATSTFAGATLFSAIFLTSKSVNFVVLGMMPLQVQEQFQWMSWFFTASVTGLIILILYYIALRLMYKNNEEVIVSKGQVRKQIDLLGRLAFKEWATLVGLAIFILGILTYSLHKIQPPWLAMSILYALLIFGTLSKKEFKEKIDWPFLIYLATVVGIISTMKSVGLDSVIAGKLTGLFYYMRYDFNLFILILSAIIFIMRLAIPINAVIVLVAAVFMPLADLAGVNSWVLGFIILVLGEMWVFPYQCSYYMQFQEMSLSKGMYDEKSFLKFNMLVNVIKIIAIYATIPYWKMAGLL